MDQAKRLKELEKENSKLKRLVAELSLDKHVKRLWTVKIFTPDRMSHERSAFRRYEVSCSGLPGWRIHPSLAQRSVFRRTTLTGVWQRA